MTTHPHSKHSAKALNFTWLALLILTLSSFLLAESQPSLITPLVLALATLKIWLIGLFFMELKEAPRGIVWTYGLFFTGLGLGLALMFSV
ncbi:MAG: hypothetical protein CVV27_20785 [Candidatus Melainabacteria bacterium HGW-Melainabacteria-1]|nr:MAG: hypothetical protein CVV27_20785 [Candidatus Melainabacteria bacterium HGW-Melainabacteria-1]